MTDVHRGGSLFAAMKTSRLTPVSLDAPAEKPPSLEVEGHFVFFVGCCSGVSDSDCNTV